VLISCIYQTFSEINKSADIQNLGYQISWAALFNNKWIFNCIDDMPAGQTPHNVTLYAHHDLVDSVQPGDRYMCICIV